MKENNRGFTLLEVLIVVLIIGVLSAIAVPQYQKAVLKSRYSAMMPIAKALAEGNEIYYMEHGNYSEEPTELVVQGKAEYPDGTEVLIYSEDGLSYVRATNDSVPNARYLVYQKHSENFADTTMCEAGDDRAKELCQALGGEEISGGNSSGENGWTAYILTGSYGSKDTFAEDSGEDTESQDTTACQPGDTPPSSMPVIDTSTTTSNTAVGTPTCVNGKWRYEWSNSKTYHETVQSSIPYEYAGSTFSGEEIACLGRAENACFGSTFNGEFSGCTGYADNACGNAILSGPHSACAGYVEHGCANSIFSGLGSICWGESANACTGSVFKSGTVCYANQPNSCDGVIFEDGSVCEGQYCPAGSPKENGGTW